MAAEKSWLKAMGVKWFSVWSTPWTAPRGDEPLMLDAGGRAEEAAKNSSRPAANKRRCPDRSPRTAAVRRKAARLRA
jgi:hypothetical protein